MSMSDGMLKDRVYVTAAFIDNGLDIEVSRSSELSRKSFVGAICPGYVKWFFAESE
jgi:hypothetical protein